MVRDSTYAVNDNRLEGVNSKVDNENFYLLTLGAMGNCFIDKNWFI